MDGWDVQIAPFSTGLRPLRFLTGPLPKKRVEQIFLYIGLPVSPHGNHKEKNKSRNSNDDDDELMAFLLALRLLVKKR